LWNLPYRRSSKGIKCFVPKAKHSRRFVLTYTPRASFLTLWHVFSTAAPTSPLPGFGKRLCSTLLLFRCTSSAESAREADRRDNKKPESPKAAVSGSFHKLAPLAAWVCCPLVGSSL